MFGHYYIFSGIDEKKKNKRKKWSYLEYYQNFLQVYLDPTIGFMN